jgi:hypothetical protein
VLQRRDYRRYRWIWWAVVLACLFSAPAVQSAQPQGRSEAEEWRSVTSADREDVPGVPLLLAAYALFAVCVTSYIVRLGRLQRRSRERLERLVAVMNDGRPSPRTLDFELARTVTAPTVEDG